jgi:hypothetical protein
MVKNLIRLALLAIIVFCVLPAAQARSRHRQGHRHKPKPVQCTPGTAFRNCPACGSATDSRHAALNVLKNRDAAVTQPQKITVQEIRDAANNRKFTPDKQVSVTGFVASVDPGGEKESCNCKRVSLRDVHINIVANPAEAGDKRKYVVVEFTPRWEERFHFDDSNYEAMRKAVQHQIGHKWVRFAGWMLYDFIHQNESASTAAPGLPTCNDNNPHQKKPCVWRGTPWEVHPVTAYQVVSGPA